MAARSAGARDAGLDGRAAAFATWWVRTYTRGVEPGLADNRRHEIASDLWEQQALGRRVGAPPSAVAASIIRRVIAGIPADLTWNHSTRRLSRGDPEQSGADTDVDTEDHVVTGPGRPARPLPDRGRGRKMISEPKVENAIALTVFAGLGLTALIGVGLRQGIAEK